MELSNNQQQKSSFQTRFRQGFDKVSTHMTRIKKGLKKAGFIFIGFILFTQILDVIGWLTDEEPIDKSSLMHITPLPAEDNGYESLRFLDDDQHRVLNKGYKNTELADLLAEPEWDTNTEKKVATLLSTHSERNALIPQVIAQQHFQSKILNSFYDDFSHYALYTDLIRLKFIESKYAAEKQNFTQAVSLAIDALVFSQRIKADKMPTLISFSVGASLQNEAISWIHQLATHYTISHTDRQQLINSIDEVSDYTNDNFNDVINGEIRFSELYLAELDYQKLSTRKEILMMAIRPEGTSIPSEIIQNTLTFFSPHFFFQQGKSSNFVYNLRHQDIKQIRQSCINVDHSHYNKQTLASNGFFNLFKANSFGNEVHSNLPSLKDFFLRRCQIDFHLQAVKTALAITQLESKQEKQVEHLDELIPQFFAETPIDASNGQPLMYDAKNRWLYSVGTNFSDDKGSLESIFHNRCFHKAPCRQNPTVPIVYQAPNIETQ